VSTGPCRLARSVRAFVRDWQRSFRHPFLPLDIGARLTLCWLLVLPLAAASAPQDQHTLYLPLVLRPPSGIAGSVTEAGVPVAGARIDLRRNSLTTGAWLLLTSVYSDSAGRYLIPNLQTLQPGQYYWVMFVSERNPSRLLWWSVPRITTYTAGTFVELASFDIAGITSLAPAFNERVSLPYTFRWTPRPATPQDSYSVRFSGSASFSSGPLGYTDSYTLSALPPGAPSGPSAGYYWLVHVAWPDGSNGVQHIDSRVYFNNAGLAGTGWLMPRSLPEP
jgi:hypothetical protein